MGGFSLYISRIHTAYYRFECLHFRYLKCLGDIWYISPSWNWDLLWRQSWPLRYFFLPGKCWVWVVTNRKLPGKAVELREVRLLEKPWLLHFSHHLLDSNFLPQKLRKNKLTPNKKIIRFSCHNWSPQQKTLCWPTFLDFLIAPLGQGCFIPVSQIVPQFTFDVEVFRGVFLPFFFPRYYWLGLKITEQLEESGMNRTHGWHSWKFNLYIISAICLPTASTNRWLFFSGCCWGDETWLGTSCMEQINLPTGGRPPKKWFGAGRLFVFRQKSLRLVAATIRRLALLAACFFKIKS